MTKSQRTRQRILDAAAKVFRQQGYANARLSDIAELAGMQTGSLYYHFDGREDLVAEILRLGIETSRAHVEAAVDALPPDTRPLERLATAIRAHTLSVLEISDYASAQARIVGQVPPELYQAHLADQRRYGGYWHDLIEDAVEAGEIRPDVDRFVIRMLVLGALNWTAEWYQPGRGASADDVADQAVSLVLHGIATSSPRPRRSRARATQANKGTPARTRT